MREYLEISSNETARNQGDEERKASAQYGYWDAENGNVPRKWLVAWCEEAEKEDESKK